ncbi:hypothetical protein HKX48_003098 [Thoreauomyces humboldtii]|nr:hypothetical protein HKX48_003098 [Thoreauomyces humboldtii]
MNLFQKKEPSMRGESSMIQDIKKAAAQGRNAEARTLAKQVTVIRAAMAKNGRVGTQVSGLNVRAQTMASSQTTANAMQAATKVMAATSSPASVMQLQKTAAAFEEQNLLSQMKEELLSDAFDSTLGESDSEGEDVAAIVDSVYDELGLEFTTTAASVPRTVLPKTQASRQKLPGQKDMDEALVQRLAGLKERAM